MRCRIPAACWKRQPYIFPCSANISPQTDGLKLSRMKTAGSSRNTMKTEGRKLWWPQRRASASCRTPCVSRVRPRPGARRLPPLSEWCFPDALFQNGAIYFPKMGRYICMGHSGTMPFIFCQQAMLATASRR